MNANLGGMRPLVVRLIPVVLVVLGVVLIAATRGPSFTVTGIDPNCDVPEHTCDVAVSLRNVGAEGAGYLSVNAQTSHLVIGPSGPTSGQYAGMISCDAPIPRTAYHGVTRVGCRLALPDGTPTDYYIVPSTISVDIGR
jgi:hypothetical protein